jgi:hypothetical protein
MLLLEGGVGMGAALLPMLLPGLVLLGGALAVSLLAQLADVLGGDSQDVLFSGQASVPNIVSEDSATIVLVVLAAKALGYAICLGCGFRGGPVFPAIFLGVALATLAVIAFDVSSTLAVAIGAGAGMAAGTRLLIAPLLFAALLVGRPGLDAIPRLCWRSPPPGSRPRPSIDARRGNSQRTANIDVSPADKVPGVDAAWLIIGILEFGIFLLMLLSIVRGEFLPRRKKSLLLVALGLALLNFACLSFGQTSTGNNAGTASLYSYFAATAVILLLVLKLPPNGPADWLDARPRMRD